MKKAEEKSEYKAGGYKDKTPTQIEYSHQIIDNILTKRQDMKQMAEWIQRMPPTICFSRVIGTGAVEKADILGSMLNYRVVERQILEHITAETKAKDSNGQSFDERYPIEFSNYLSLLFSKKGFKETVFNQHLFATILSVAGLAPTIFVG